MASNNAKSFNVGKLMRLPMKAKLVILALLCLLLSFLFYWFVSGYQQGQQKSWVRKEMLLRQTFKSRYLQLVQLKKTTEETTVLKGYLDKLGQYLLTQQETSQLLEQITKLGTGEGLKFISFKPQMVEQKTYYAEMPINVGLVGTYEQLGQFLDKLANDNKFIVATDFVLARRKRDDVMLTMNLVLNVYYKSEGVQNEKK